MPIPYDVRQAVRATKVGRVVISISSEGDAMASSEARVWVVRGGRRGDNDTWLLEHGYGDRLQ